MWTVKKLTFQMYCAPKATRQETHTEETTRDQSVQNESPGLAGAVAALRWTPGPA